MTVMVQCYAIFWLLTSIASLKMVMERLGADEDDERQKEQRDREEVRRDREEVRRESKDVGQEVRHENKSSREKSRIEGRV